VFGVGVRVVALSMEGEVVEGERKKKRLKPLITAVESRFSGIEVLGLACALGLDLLLMRSWSWSCFFCGGRETGAECQ